MINKCTLVDSSGVSAIKVLFKVVIMWDLDRVDEKRWASTLKIIKIFNLLFNYPSKSKYSLYTKNGKIR